MVASLIHVLSETRLSFSLKGKFSCFGSKEPYLVNTMTDFQTNEVQLTVAGLRSYQVPEFLVLPVSGGSESYLAWLEASLR
jgi:uncharacterized protein involved in tolerance to divalent cations